MAETLRNRVTRIIAGSAHALLNRIEDAQPLAMLEQSVREVEQVTEEVRTELGRAVASRHLAQQQHLHLNREYETLAGQTVAALAQERDDLAKAAIARQLDIEAQLPVLENSLSDLAQQERELSGYVDALLGKGREMKAAIADLQIAQKAANQSAATAKNPASSGKLQAAESAFERIYQHQSGLGPLTQGKGLEQAARLRELNDMVRDNKINERLAALKGKSGE